MEPSVIARLLAAVLLALCGSAHALDLRDYGGRCDFLSDNTPALNAALAAAVLAPSDRTINIPGGLCLFYSQPNIVPGQVSIVGQGKAVTVLRKMFQGNFLRVRGEGARIAYLEISADSSATWGYGIEILSDNTLLAANVVIESVWITGPGTWDTGVGVWGSARTLSPIGARTIYLRDVTILNATWSALTFWGCVACEWWGGGAYMGGGSTERLIVGGSPTPSSRIRIDANVNWGASSIEPGTLRTQ